MKSRTLMFVTALTLLAALATPLRLAAQDNQRGLVGGGATSAKGPTLTVLHTFTGSDGSAPYGGLVRDKKGNLYGTTYLGGGTGCGGFGCGVVFKLASSGKETVLYSFSGGTDGRYPVAGLVRDATGNLYGTTTEGGNTNSCQDGCGVVFKLDPAGKQTVLYSFNGATDEGIPYSGLIRDTSGNLYGTTTHSYNGTAFKLDPTGTETLLHHFGGRYDAAAPFAGLVRDEAGNLYGTTVLGGDKSCYCGAVFKLDATGAETILHKFTGRDGANPYASLVRDKAGNFYGTTYQGGGTGCGGHGCGTVFLLDTGGRESVLHSFTGKDGQSPYAGLVRDRAGNFYGTTYLGGASGVGVVYKLTPAGKETVLHSFTGTDGATPWAGLIRDAAGNLYGTTAQGGVTGQGVVFKLTP
jgi:uncharacterized repeat protein (TIGR03803 family)